MNIMDEQKKLINKTKICTKCDRELSIDNFSKDKTRKDGLYSWCKECSSKYIQTYQQTNKEHYNQYRNQYYNQFKGCYLYIILNKQDEIVYVGQTTNFYKRLMQHLSGYVDATKELFTSGNWSCIKYLDVGDIVENDLELKAMENELIELYKPRLNTVKNVIHDINRGRLFGLLAQLHSILNEWIVFKSNNN